MQKIDSDHGIPAIERRDHIHAARILTNAEIRHILGDEGVRVLVQALQREAEQTTVDQSAGRPSGLRSRVLMRIAQRLGVENEFYG